METAKKTWNELVAGVIVLMIVECIVYIFISENVMRSILGALLGCVIAIAFLWHMFRSLGNALDMDEDNANKYFRKKLILRLAAVAAMLALTVLVSDYVSVLTTFISVLGVKFSAYFQPLTNKLFSKTFYD